MTNSPFPGMDPFLEQDWLDFHSAMVTYSCDQIQDQLPDDLCARLRARMFVEDEDREVRAERHPDVRVVEAPGSGGTAVLERPQLGTLEPDLWLVSVRREPATQRYVEIVDSQTRSRVITSIELISPSNKLPGAGQELYRQKQSECLGGGVNLVEIDLTRRGNRLAILPELSRIEPPTTYVACVRRANSAKTAVYLLPLERPLKPISIPLRKNDQDVVLDLQPLVMQAYTRGRYSNLDYSRPLDPPANKDEAAFVERMLREARKR